MEKKFKYDLLKKLAVSNKVECLYLRLGPSHDIKNIDFLRSQGVTFKRLTISYSIMLKDSIISIT